MALQLWHAIVGLVILAIPACNAGNLLDLTNPGQVSVELKTLLVSSPDTRQFLVPGIAPIGDYRIIGTTPEGNPAVFDVNESWGRIGHPQRTELFSKIVSLRQKSAEGGCNIATIATGGLNFNIGIKRYQIAKDIKSACPPIPEARTNP
jgi:hypothetical protein